jgi:HSP20 family protein
MITPSLLNPVSGSDSRTHPLQELKMDYIKIRFGSDPESLASRLERSIEDIFRPRPVSPMFTSNESSWMPSMDMYETVEEIIIRAEMAGVEKDHLEVEINSRAVKISGSRRELPCQENSTYRLAEIQYGQFERVLYLPCPIDPEVVSSNYTNGFLQLRLAKKRAEESFSVPISDG